ncbi:MAG TPA: SurA N-terminal domain-containing protein [Burkholderiaceae bacterium]
MFEFVRTHNKIIQVAMGIVLIPSFVFFGVQSYTHSGADQSEAVAEVDGTDITRAQWDAQTRNALERLREQGRNVDPKTLDTPEARRAALDAVIREHVLQAVVEKDRLPVTNDRVNNFIRTSPEFAQLMAMPPEQRKAVLAAQGMTPEILFSRVQAAMQSQQALVAPSASGFLPAVADKASADAWLGQRAIQWQRFDVKDYLAATTPTEAQIKAYYDDKSHAAEFTAPEQAKIEYVVLDANALKAQVAVTDDALKKYYEDNKANFNAPEERRVSHILINVAPNASADDVAKAKAKAEAVLAEVRKNPAGFADIAKKESQDAGSAANGGDLDFMKRGAIPGAFSDTMFSMKEGDISDVVRSEAGFHILKLTGIRGGAPKPFEEVRAEVEDQYRTQQARKLYEADSEKFTNTVYEQPDSLQPVVDAFKLARQTATVTRTPAADATGPLASPKLLAAIFASDSLQGKHNTEAIETGPGQLAAARVVQYTAQHLKSFAEVHDQAADALRKSLAAAAAKKDADARIAQAAKDASIALPQVATVGRTVRDSNVPPQVTEAALKADVSKGPTVVGVALPDGSYAAIRVLKALPPAPQDLAQFKSVIGPAYQDAESQALYDAYKARMKTKVDETRVAKALSSAASAPN